jgi:hypothetical protein
MTGGNVMALAASGSTLYAGGDFTNAGGVAASSIAQWDGTTWTPLGSGINGNVNALAVSAGTLYAGGGFSMAGTSAAQNIAQWHGSNWSALGSGISVANGGIGPYVSGLAVSGSTLYAGGQFASAGGVPANNIAQWNGTNWSPLGSGIGFTFTVAVSGSVLYAGGSFIGAGTNVAYYFAEAILPVPLSILTTDSNFGLTNGYFGFDVAGPPGSNVVIQTSTDLQTWLPLQTNTLNPTGLLYFSDTQSPATTQRFYNVVLP